MRITRWQINLYAAGRDRRFCLILLLYFSAADHRRKTPNFVGREENGGFEQRTIYKIVHESNVEE